MPIVPFYPGQTSKIYDINEAGQAVGVCDWDPNAGTTQGFLFQNGQMLNFSYASWMFSVATQINQAGDVMGYRRTPSHNANAFLYTRSGQLLDLGTLGGTNSQGLDMNESGDVVGRASTPGNASQHAFLYRNGQMMDIDPIGSNYSFAGLINNAGDVVISAHTATGSRCFLRTRSDQTIELTTGTQSIGGVAINEAGDVIGSSWNGQYSRAWLYRNGTMTFLGLGGLESTPFYLNEAGDVAGWAQTPTGQFHGFLYTRNGVMVDLGPDSVVRELNEAGDVVGIVNVAPVRMFLYRNGQVSFLNQPGTQSFIVGGHSSNAAGQVVVNERIGGAVPKAYLYESGNRIPLSIGGDYSAGHDINLTGDVVGQAWTVEGRSHAFAFHNGQMLDLGTLGNLMVAERITNSGYITGRGRKASSDPIMAFVTHLDQAADHTPPVISGVQAISLDEFDPAGTTVNLGSVTVFDMVDEHPLLINDAPAAFMLGQTVVTWTATDRFGNVSTQQQVVTILPGPPSNQLDNLGEIIEDFTATGGVSSQAAGSLDAKVDAALSALAQGNANAAVVAMNDLKALVNYVNAQTGNHITAEAAAEIVARANALIVALGG